MAPQRDNSESVCTSSCGAHGGRDRKHCRGVSQPSTQWRSSLTMAKGSTDVQAVVERLLWIVTACGMPFKGLFRIASRKQLKSKSLSTTVCTSVETFAIVHALLDRVHNCERHPDKACYLIHLLFRTKKCRYFPLNYRLLSYFKMHNPFSSISVTEQWVG